MQRPSDERLIAYLDGELDAAESAEIARWLERDAGLRDRAALLSESAALLRSAYDDVLREPLPERLIAAARGAAEAPVVDIAAARARRWKRYASDRRWWIGVPVAASLMGLMVGGGVGYFAGNGSGQRVADLTAANTANLVSGSWLDNIAGYHKLFVNAGSNDVALADVPANDGGDAARKVAQKLPPDFRLPNLKPWGLDFQGARFLIIEGRPATQLFYTTDNKALGPLTVVVGTSSRPDLAPTFEHRDDVNLLYWRHHGHAYALVGTADIGYLWNIQNDIAWQLDAI
jgi:anti-sigma factor RsiW